MKLLEFTKELELFPPIDLKKIQDKNERLPENIRESIYLYNKALENIKTKSEDIAIIELKKTISLNPEFSEARNLLGLSYYSRKEFDKAKEVFKEIINLDLNCLYAMKYLTELGDTSFTEKYGFVLKKKLRIKVSNEVKDSSSTVKNISRWIIESLNFKKGFTYESKKLITGLAIGIVFTLGIILPVVFVQNSSLALNSVDISFCQGINGGGIYSYNSTVNINNSMLDSNVAERGGAINGTNNSSFFIYSSTLCSK